MTKTAFAPVYNERTRVLILGSLPGDASLKAAQYYAHPRNGFWPLIGQVLDEPLASLPYADRLERLLARGVGLWDVLASAERSGSLDAAIRSPEAADLRGFVERLPRLAAIGFNGGLAAKLGQRILGDVEGIELIALPSSSPAHAISLSAKAQTWAILGKFLPDSLTPQ
ncbi:hypothetical protein LTR94_028587 [Friedmanniomyces endolithicus]|nr:hypothetical protein LTR94_028587 [Friedmanniomyces endolithicus]